MAPCLTVLARMTLGSTIGITLLTALHGCVDIGPDYHPPQIDIPAYWHVPTGIGMSDSQRLIQWWLQFDDPAMTRLIALAESDNPSLSSAWASIERARATLNNAKADGLPSIDASASGSRAKQQSVQDSGETISTSRSAGLDASWEIDLFGKIRRNVEAAEARLEARIDDWHDARVSLAAEVADNYVQYRACRMLVLIYTHELESRRQTQSATAGSVRAGFSSLSDGALTRASVASSRSTLLAQQAQCDLLVKSLVALTGTDEEPLRVILAQQADRLPRPNLLEVLAIPAQVVRQRPDLGALERELAATSAEIGVARADLYPSLSLSGSISVSSSDLVSRATTWSFGPTLSLPLFDGGRRRAAVASAEAAYASAWQNYRQGVRDAIEEVEQTLVNLDSAARRTGEAETAAREYRKHFEATQASWRAGQASLLTLEEARRLALSADIDALALQRDRLQNWIALYKALGGGWQTSLPATAPTRRTEQKQTTQRGMP